MIYPVPQKNNLNGEKINIKSVSVSGDFKDLAEKIFSSYSIEINNGFKNNKLVCNLCKNCSFRKQKFD